MAGKARVHELAKELGVTSKEILGRLSEQGEFVKSASSTIEAPVARRLRESFRRAAMASGAPSQETLGSSAPAAPTIRVRDLATELGVTNKQILAFLLEQGESAKSSSSGVNLVVAERVREAFNSATRFVVARVPTELDDADTPDSLGVDFDARALAALIASQHMKPPLAVGVYGRWGSGKTFFMRRVEHWIRRLEEPAGPRRARVFEHGIAHVWFSAWHYSAGSSKANIWASLMIHIFEALHPKLSEREQKIADVLEHVDAAKGIRDDLERRLVDAQAVVESAQQSIKQAKQKYRAAAEEAARIRGRDLLDAIKASDLGDLTGLNEAAFALGLDRAGSSVREVTDRARQICELGGRAKFLATAGPVLRSPLAYAVYGIIAVAIGTFALRQVLETHELSSATIASLGQFAAVCTAAAAWIGRQGSLARSLLRPAEDIQSKVNERLRKVRECQVRDLAAAEERETTAAAQIVALTEELAQASAAVIAAETERERLTGQELLRRYLAERASSSDYDQHKGVVTLVHQDLEQLSDHLTAALRDSADEAGLRRIVLYIDDLDRCDPYTVSNVLAAVHLLLALPLFTVLVGVDPRWLERSLQETNKDLFKNLIAPQMGSIHQRDLYTSPTDYLEKIFHLTYTVPAMTPAACERLISATLQDILRGSDSASTPPTAAAGDEQERDLPESNGSVSPPMQGVSTPDGLGSVVDRVVLGLGLHPSDRHRFKEVAPLVATTPRRAKRFISTYFVVRARAFIESRKHPRSNLENSGGLLLLVALMTGVPNAALALGADRYVRPTSTIGEWVDGLLIGGSLLPEEHARLGDFRSTPNSLADLSVDEVTTWWSLARPYATFVVEGEVALAQATSCES